MKFLVDAQLPARLARALAAAGHDALHSRGGYRQPAGFGPTANRPHDPGQSPAVGDELHGGVGHGRQPVPRSPADDRVVLRLARRAGRTGPPEEDLDSRPGGEPDDGHQPRAELRDGPDGPGRSTHPRPR